MPSLKDWPLYQQPREKLIAEGSENLSDSELIAIFLGSGVKGKTAVDIAHELLAETGSLKKLLQSHSHFFYQKKGVGKVKYILIKAAIELGRRYLEEALPLGEKLTHPTQTKQLLSSRLSHYTREVFTCLFLDNRNRILAFDELFQGTLSETSVYPREIIKRSLEHNAAKIILAHNHPSGDPSPSLADQELTQSLKHCLSFVDIQLIDHIIVGHQKCCSLAEMGFL